MDKMLEQLIKLIELLSKEGSLRIIFVAMSVVFIILMFRWIFSRSSTLFSEHDKIREDLSNDRVELRKHIEELMERNEKLQIRNDEQAKTLHKMALKELELKTRIIDQCKNFKFEEEDL